MKIFISQITVTYCDKTMILDFKDLSFIHIFYLLLTIGIFVIQKILMTVLQNIM